MKICKFALIAIGLAGSTTAMAHGWDHHNGWREREWRAHQLHNTWNGHRNINEVCSGRRGNMLESRIRYQENQGDINRWQARDMNSAIDRLEDRQRVECRQGDWDSVRDIAHEYDRISNWIDRESRERRW